MTAHRAALPVTPGFGGTSQLAYLPSALPPVRRQPGPWAAPRPRGHGSASIRAKGHRAQQCSRCQVANLGQQR